MRIGILTSGGDCPGLNAVIRAAVIKADEYDHEVSGFLQGWKGVLESNFIPLQPDQVRHLAGTGGTILGSSRTNPFEGVYGGATNIKANLDSHGIDAIIAIGGEGTLTAARLLSEKGINIIGVPKTIDNDIAETDYSFGFDTAVEIAVNALDRIHTTAQSHGRCMVVEVMGRDVGWIALHAGMASGSHAILVPEHPLSIEEIAATAQSVRDRGEAPVFVVSEGFRLSTMTEAHSYKGVDPFNRPLLGGIADVLAPQIEELTGIETRATTLGHLQRGGAPTAYDRVLATRLGLSAIEAAHRQQWGSTVVLRGTQIETVGLHSATHQQKSVPQERLQEVSVLLG